jgi:hypothetical protein
MKKRMFYFLVLMFAIQTFAVWAQTAEKPKPRFTLIISLVQPGSHPPGGAIFRYLEVVETNVSFESIWQEVCPEERGIFGISILYNGVPLQERDAVAR